MSGSPDDLLERLRAAAVQWTEDIDTFTLGQIGAVMETFQELDELMSGDSSRPTDWRTSFLKRAMQERERLARERDDLRTENVRLREALSRMTDHRDRLLRRVEAYAQFRDAIEKELVDLRGGQYS